MQKHRDTTAGGLFVLFRRSVRFSKCSLSGHLGNTLFARLKEPPALSNERPWGKRLEVNPRYTNGRLGDKPGSYRAPVRLAGFSTLCCQREHLCRGGPASSSQSVNSSCSACNVLACARFALIALNCWYESDKGCVWPSPLHQ